MGRRLERLENNIGRLQNNIGRIALIPSSNGRLQQNNKPVPAPAGRGREQQPFRSTLVSTPCDIFVLWQEYEFGVGGRKPAKLFNQTERGRVKYKYSLRKIVWDCIDGIIRSGYTADAAIDKIYEIYGRDKGVTQIIRLMREDKNRRGGHPELS
mmetsp:Transcript_11854/g.17783  ORF Transcript_11854/g.17783 Transcript_11854/m.17783 type:complete len:154 (+) Transcript_11854:363-824(+)